MAAAQAQDADVADTAAAERGDFEEIVVTGLRGRPRIVNDSPVPIDMLAQEELESVSFVDTHNVLQTLIPSYNVARAPISDGASFIRPALMRGLPSDKTLVLVNSKRRHRAALVTIGGSGNQGPDVATIPMAAIKSVEVLHDGAAAQYGSDAIAGVINFILKDEAEGGSLTVGLGEYGAGDGRQAEVHGNFGLSLGSSGFFSAAIEYSKKDATIRAEQYCETWFCLDPGNPLYDPEAAYARFTSDADFMAGVAALGQVAQPWGQPNSEALRLFFNAAHPLGGGREFYAFGNYSASDSDTPFFYRYPYNGTIEDLRRPDGSIYSPLEKYPGGFTPRFFGEVFDHSLLAGLRGSLAGGLNYDLSARVGESEIQYTLKRTINPSLGPASPQSFRPGDLRNHEAQFQGDFSYEFDLGLPHPMVVAFGLSYLAERYEVIAGELASYQPGPYATPDPWDFCHGDGTATAAGQQAIAAGSGLNCADPEDPVYTVVAVGSNGFPGYSPRFSQSYKRASRAAYLDVSADLAEGLFLQAAARFEDYSDFGSELVGKAALKFDVSDFLALRSSISTGFRAPTPGQQGTINVATRIPAGFPVATGLFPASSAVAAALGATPLRPETSANYAFGFVASLEQLTLTLDFYRVKVQDRTNAISTLPVSTEPSAGAAYGNYLALAAAEVPGAESIGGVFYFTNAFDTVTRGLDLIAAYPLFWDNGASTVLTASMNYNQTKFDSDPHVFINAEGRFDFIHANPKLRGVFTARHSQGDYSLMARVNYYGSSENSNVGGSPLRYQKHAALALVDLEARHQLNETLELTIGGRNVFDRYPDKDAIGDFCCGRLYSSSTTVDWQGSYYYFRLAAFF